MTKPGKRLKSRSTVPKLRDAGRDTDRRNPCIVHHRSSHSSVFELFLEEIPVRAGFGEQFRNRGFQPRFDLVHASVIVDGGS